MMNNILVTGCTGFIGRAVISSLQINNKVNRVIASVRDQTDLLPEGVQQVQCGDLSTSFDWHAVLSRIDVVIHCAARVHIMNDSVVEPLAEYRKINTAGTLNLARQSAEAGVKRFIFISSVKVNGETNKLGEPFKPEDNFVPDDPYGLSKYETEQGLLVLAEETGLEVVIIRPPLVYGPYVKGNFSSMINWVNRGVPLPFGAIHNKRSLVALDNLVGFIVHCIEHPKAANEVFLISDGEDVSTTELLQKVAKAFGKQSLLVPVPTWLMAFVATLIGKENMTNKLFNSLQVDNSKACDLLGWKPVITMAEQLKKIADAP